MKLYPLLVVLIVGQAFAEITFFDADGSIGPGDVYDVVVVRNNAQVDMTGGDVEIIHVMESAALDFGGVELSSSYPGPKIRLYDQAKLDISVHLKDSSGHRIFASGNSKVNVNITSDWAKWMSVELFDNAQLVRNSGITGVTAHGNSRITFNSGGDLDRYEVQDGRFIFFTGSATLYNHAIFVANGAESFNVAGYDDSSVETYSGSGSLELSNGSKATISGGTIANIFLSQHSYCLITGGQIERIEVNVERAGDELSGSLTHDSTIVVLGDDQNLFPYGGQYGEGFVSGKWLNEEFFDISLDGARTYFHIHTIDDPLCGFIGISDTINVNDVTIKAKKRSSIVTISGNITRKDENVDLSNKELAIGYTGVISETLPPGSLRKKKDGVYVFKKPRGYRGQVRKMLLDFPNCFFSVVIKSPITALPSGPDTIMFNMSTPGFSVRQVVGE